MPKLTVAEKQARGTHQDCRDSKRDLTEIRAEIADALEGIEMMRANLQLAVRAIKEKGMYVLSTKRHNDNTEVTEERLNPAFRVQREALAGLKHWKRALILLREEEQIALKATQPEKDEFEGL